LYGAIAKERSKQFTTSLPVCSVGRQNLHSLRPAGGAAAGICMTVSTVASWIDELSVVTAKSDLTVKRRLHFMSMVATITVESCHKKIFRILAVNFAEALTLTGLLFLHYVRSAFCHLSVL
jgi:hypothetical protein